MNNDWIKRNWPLALGGGVIALMIVKKLIIKLSTVDTTTIGENISHTYLWIIVLAIVATVIWGNKQIKTAGIIAAVILMYFFFEDIINFDIASTTPGKAVATKWGDANWLWVPLVIGGIIVFNKILGNKIIDSMMTLMIKGLGIFGILWIIADITGFDDKLFKALDPPIKIEGCTDATKLTNDGGISTYKDDDVVQPNIPKCITVNQGTVKNIVLNVHDSRCSLVIKYNPATYNSRPDLYGKVPVTDIILAKPITNQLRREYRVNERLMLDAGLNVTAFIVNSECPF